MKENKDNKTDNIDNENPLKNGTANNIIYNNNLVNNEAISNSLNASKPILTPLSQITENLYLGNLYDAQNISNLLKIGIQKVLSLIADPQLLCYPKEIEHKFIKIIDFPRENIIQYFGECLLFIEDNKKILVHCVAGASRSATIVIAYLMWKNQLDYKESAKFVEQIRPCINPNYGFVRQLQIFEKLLKKHKYNINTINFKGITYPRFFEECCF
jgi:protein-tyrosine phosphatase